MIPNNIVSSQVLKETPGRVVPFLRAIAEVDAWDESGFRRVHAALERLHPVRALLFLRGVGTHSGVRSALALAGFAETDHREGWELLGVVCAWDGGGLDPEDDRTAREASAELVAFARDHFPRLRAALEHLHPEAVGVFDGLNGVGAREADAVVGVGTWPERVAAMAREGDGGDVAAREALTTLDRRGAGHAERTRLAALVNAAVRVTAPTSMGPVRAARDAETLALYRWYTDWAVTARTVIKRRDWLAVLGLVGRKREGPGLPAG